MSEFLAEASVLIQANTVAFRKELAAALATVPKAIEIPVVAVGGAGGASAAATRREVAAATMDSAAAAETAAAAVNAEAAARQRAGVEAKQQTTSEVSSAAALRAAAKTRREITQGITAQAASVAGLRGQLIGANGAFLAATAGAILFFRSLSSASSFEQELNVFSATAGATADQMRRVSEEAKALGNDITLPGVAANDAATALTELSKAGLSVGDALDAARGTLQLATAAAIDNAEATELVASALNAFGLAGSEATHVADLLAGASKESQGSISDVGIALRQSAAAAAQAGVSVEDTVTLLTELGRAGLRGSDAGTSLRTAFLRLINPTKKANEELEKLGVEIRDASGNVRPEIFADLNTQLSKLTKSQHDAALAIIFGNDAFRAAAILGREGAAGFRDVGDAVNQVGLAAQLANARTQGFSGQVEALKNSAATLGLEVGQRVIPALSGIARELTTVIGLAADAASALNKLPKLPELPSLPVPGLSTGGDTSGVDDADKKSGHLLVTLKSLRNEIDLLSSGNLNRFGESAGTTIARLNNNIISVVDNTDNLVAALNKTSDAEAKAGAGGGAQQGLQKLRDGLVGSGAAAEAARKKIDDVSRLVAALGRAPTRVELQVFLEKGAIDQDLTDLAKAAQIPVELLPPDFQKSVVFLQRDAVKGGQVYSEFFNKTVGAGLDPSVFQNFTFQGIQQARAAAVQAAGDTASAVAAKVDEALRASRLRTGALASEKIALEFQGASPQQIRANLEKTLAAQKVTVTRLVKKRATRANIDIARQNAIDTQHSIDAIDAASAAAAESARDKARQRTQKAQNDAKALAQKKDTAVFDSLVGGQNRINLAQIDANATARLSDDIAVQKLIANTASREIAIIDKSVKDVKARNAAIAARVQILKAAAAELDRLRKEQADAQATKAQTARDAVTTNLEKKLQLAQIIGKKDPILTAFDALIANERKNLAAAKKADKLDALIKLRQTIKDRNDFLEDIKKDAADGVKQATTAFDLLTQFSQTFNQNAGNLINGNQPFAGPTGFTADIAQFLIRRQAKPQAATSPFPGKAADDKLVSSQSSLTDAILSLRDTIANTQGNKSTAFGTVDTGVGSIAQRWHRANQMQRQFQEA